MTLPTPLRASAVYFAIVFGAGFVFGTIRTLLLEPRLGVRVAELAELPLMIVVIFFAARWINRRFLADGDHSSRLIAGLSALGLLLLAEVVLGMILRGQTPAAVLFSRDPVSGTAYYVSLCVFGLMPWLLGRIASAATDQSRAHAGSLSSGRGPA